jgi:hypothetical protein
MADVVGLIMAYEMGELPEDQALELFSELVKTGMVWGLQGSYGRTAEALISFGFLTPDGEITDLARETLGV